MNEAAGRGLPAPVPRDRRRVVIEDVTPVVDGGRFPVKRTVGEPIDVEADVFADGDDDLRVLLRHRVIAAGTGESPWHTMPMTAIGQDRWRARFTPEVAGYAEYAVVAWVDQFGTWRRQLREAAARGAPVASDLLEGAEMVRRAANAARSGLGGRPSPTREAASERLLDWSAELRAPADEDGRVRIALSDDLAADMTAWSPAISPVTHVPLRARVERPVAACAAWLSWPAAAARASFDSIDGDGPEAEDWMTRVAALGFDVLMLPPFADGVPPTPEPAALAHPDLGTMDDVARLARTASNAGLELAVDFACHGSRHHPYVTDHPEWFQSGPDGRMKRAPAWTDDRDERLAFDFDGEAWDSLWEELRRVVQFWIDAGIRTFRLDRPDEKPLVFWEWLIADVHRDHADVVFVAGSSPRESISVRLAKIGATQSAVELGDSPTRAGIARVAAPLVAAPIADVLRLHLSAPASPATGAFERDPDDARLRLALAATLGGVCHVTNVSADALDISGPRGWPDLVRRLNAVRRAHTAFRPGSRVTFHDADNPMLLCFSRVSADGGDRAIVVVNLDPKHMQHGFVTIPAASWGLPATYAVTDELGGGHFEWKDGANYVRLDPASEPAHLLTIG